MTTANSTSVDSNKIAKRSGKSSFTSTEADSDLDLLLWRLQARTKSNPDLGAMFGLTSCGAKSGVTTLAANLSARAANSSMGPVLLIDANISTPRLHRMFRMGGKPGLVDLLIGSSTPEECIKNSGVEELDILPVGSKEAIQTGRVLPDSYAEVTSWIRERYRTIFIDLPTIEEMRHSLFLARLTDITIVAVRSEGPRRSSVASSVQGLVDDGVNIGGTVLTRRRVYTPRWLRND